MAIRLPLLRQGDTIKCREYLQHQGQRWRQRVRCHTTKRRYGDKTGTVPWGIGIIGTKERAEFVSSFESHRWYNCLKVGRQRERALAPCRLWTEFRTGTR